VTAAVGTTKAFDALLVVHALVAITSLVVLAVLGAAGAAASNGAPLGAAASRSFTGRVELAGRVVHLLPVSGVGLLAVSRGAYTTSTWFVVVGLVGWLATAGLLEGAAFPAQREVAVALAAGADARGAGTRMVRAVELAGVVLVAVAIVMIAGPFA